MDLYPMAGTSDDYAFGRHFVDQQGEGLFEWYSPKLCPLSPPYPEMQKIVQETTAALFAFCIAATQASPGGKCSRPQTQPLFGVIASSCAHSALV